MFQAGERIVCDHNCVCRILSIAEQPGLKKGTLYYELEPVGKPGSRIFVPVDSKKLVLRPVISREEVMKLIREIPQIETVWIVNEKKREEQYREIAKKYDCREWIKIIKTTYQRKKSRRQEGKKITYIDEKYMKMAQENLYGELGVSLSMPAEQVEDFILEKIREQKITK